MVYIKIIYISINMNLGLFGSLRLEENNWTKFDAFFYGFVRICRPRRFTFRKKESRKFFI